MVNQPNSVCISDLNRMVTIKKGTETTKASLKSSKEEEEPSSPTSMTTTKHEANLTENKDGNKYNTEEIISLREFLLKYKEDNGGSKMTGIPENATKSILKKMILFTLFFREDEELTIHPDKMKISTKDGELTNFCYLDTLKFKTLENDKEYIMPSMYENRSDNKCTNIEAQRVWAIGIILFEMLVGERPFLAENIESASQTELDQIILSQACDILSPEAIDLITSCLSRVNQNQIKIKNIFKHSWFKK